MISANNNELKKYIIWFIIFFISANLFAGYIYSTNKIIQEKIIEQLEKEISDKYIVEMTRLGMENNRNNQAFVLYLTFNSTFQKLYSLFLFILICWGLFSLWLDVRLPFKDVAIAGLTSSFILAIGTLIDLALIFITGQIGSHFGLTLFLNTFGLHHLLTRIIRNYNIITLLFIGYFSLLISKLYNEKFIILFILSFISVLSLILVTYLVGIHLDLHTGF